MRKKSLAETHPKLAKEWHPTKNIDITPYDISVKSEKKVWWKCDKGDNHEWCTTPLLRYNNGGKCKICNSLAIKNPELSKQWHPTKNGNLTPFKVGKSSPKKVWWKCEKGEDHEWISSINNRSNGNGCPICIGKKIVKSNCLATTHPEIAKQWHPTKNGKSNPYNIGGGSGKRFWWKCEKGDDHEWITSPSNRTRKGGRCAICRQSPARPGHNRRPRYSGVVDRSQSCDPTLPFGR